MASSATATPGALGGAAGEDGSEYRARVGALLSTALIRGTALQDVGLPVTGSVPVLLQAETDDAVDDLVVTLADGARVFVQAKLSVGLSASPDSPFGAALRQYAAATRGDLLPDDRLVLASAHPTEPIRRLQKLLDRRRFTSQGDPAPAEGKAWEAFARLATKCGITADELDRVAAHLVIWPTDPMTGDGEGMLVARLEGHVVVSGQGLQAARDLSDEVRVLARARAGRDALQFTEALLSRGLELAAGAPATSPVAWARALADYRARAVRDGTTLRLFGAPAELRNLPLADADAGIEVDGDALTAALRIT